MIAEKVDKGFILSYQFRCHIYLYELPPEDVASYRSKMYHLIGVRCIIFQRTPVDVFLHGFYLTLFSLINDICRQI